MQDPPAIPRRPRKDAERNRERLIAAAGEVFAERGLDATMHDIAARAGVGVGTAYRRFANKNEIVDALFDARLDEVASHAEQALQNPDAWQGFTSFLETSLQMQLEDRGLKEILNNPHLGRERLHAARDRIGPLIDRLVARAQDEGQLRPDFEASDFIFIQLALAALMDETRTSEPTLYRRYLTMFLDGVRVDRGALSELPVRGLSHDQTHSVILRQA